MDRIVIDGFNMESICKIIYENMKVNDRNGRYEIIIPALYHGEKHKSLNVLYKEFKIKKKPVYQYQDISFTFKDDFSKSIVKNVFDIRKTYHKIELSTNKNFISRITVYYRKYINLEDFELVYKGAVEL